MSEAMSLPDYLKAAPAVTSLSGLSVTLVNSLGEPQRASAMNFTKRLAVGGLDLNDMGSEPGVSILVTSDTTLNVPPGKTFGFVINVVFSEPNVFQVFFSYSAGGGIWERRKNSGNWASWTQKV